MTQTVDQRIAAELGVTVRQVSAAVELLDGGATVPFIARYRKEGLSRSATAESAIVYGLQGIRVSASA